MEIISTKDGSHSISLRNNLTYHSSFGAVNESLHIFIGLALDPFHRLHPEQKKITVFEMGFGTGLNALLTLQYALTQNVVIDYHAIELKPLPKNIWSALNYDQIIPGESFHLIHSCQWNCTTNLNPSFSITKYHADLLHFDIPIVADVIYYDAFDPEAQFELWSKNIFYKLYSASSINTIMSTYCSKGKVRRNMKEAGWKVSKHRGPEGKREVVCATLA